MNRIKYTPKQYEYIEQRLNPHFKSLMEDFVTRYDFDDIVYGKAVSKTVLMSDLLCQDITNSISLSQVGGLPVRDAVSMAVHNLNNQYIMLQLDAAFIQ